MKITNLKLIICNPFRFIFDRWECKINGKFTQILVSYPLGIILVYFGNVPKQLLLKDYNNYDGNMINFLSNRLPNASNWNKLKEFENHDLFRQRQKESQDPKQITLF